MRMFVFLLLVFAGTSALYAWTPPENPSPGQILDEAREDARVGRYHEALQKHLWFHDNALKYNQAFYGVRLSFALSSWQELGINYPEALVALAEVRDISGESVRAGINYYDSFHDYQSINERLNEEYKTVEMFRWLDRERKDWAKQVYRIAQPTLIRAEEYELCGTYIDPQNSYLRYVSDFRSGLEFAKRSSFYAKSEKFSYSMFVNDVTTLVALLVRSGRSEEAEDVAEMAMLEWDNEGFSSALSKALQGHVPKPWP